MPIWKNADLIAGIEDPRKASIEDGRRLIAGIAKRLGLDAGYVLPAHEDPAHWLQKEDALPVNVDPTDSRLADAEERARMARVFNAGLNKISGFVLPVQNAGARRRWLDQRTLAVAARQSVPDTGRLAARAAAADVVADGHSAR